MKSYLYFSALATLTLASCSDNEVIDAIKAPAGSPDGRISFVQRTENSTRSGSQQAQNAGHYEFGVYAFKGTTAGSTTTSVMDNYLVAYGEASNNLYNLLKTQASTYGTNAGGNYTDVENQVSSWFYEGIGISGASGDGLTWGNTGYTKPDFNQILKYWDKNQAVHDFYAFMPYATKETAVGTMNPTQVTYSSNALTYIGINAFATSTAQKLQSTSPYQISGARVNENATGAQNVIPSSTSTDAFNKEILNYNEGLYAYTSVSQANYEKDVELTFKHLNAKVNVAFYEDIKGYKVELIDLVPDAAVTEINTKFGASTIEKAHGVQFSPATLLQAEEPMASGHPQPTALPTYNSAATIKVSNLNTTPVIAHTTGTEIKKNLVFEATNNAAATIAGSGASRMFIGESRANKTLSATTLYPLGIYNGSEYITQSATTTSFQTSSTITTTTPSSKVGDVTGYTLHVSYKMIPQDGSTDITIYDARVHVAAEYCKWEAGKAYTYIFKITDRANGVTDPTTVDPETSGTGSEEPWIDPEDPRVPDDPALTPIVFDGVMVTDYDEANTGKENDVDEWVLSDPDSWTFFLAGGSGTKTFYDNSGVYGKTAVADILNRFNIAASPITDVQWNGTLFNVDFADGTADNTVNFKPSSYTKDTRSFATWKTNLTASNVTFAGGTADEVKSVLEEATEITIAKPAFNVWSSATEAVPYVAVPTAILLTPYDVVYKVTGTDVSDGTNTYETGKIITAANYSAIKTHDVSQTSQITVTAKFKPTVTYETATNITAGSAATAGSAYLIVTKK